MKKRHMFSSVAARLMAIGALFAMCHQSGWSQTYSFEDSKLPANWTVQNATVSFTDEHSTVDNISMMVEVPAGQTAVITAPFPTPKKQTNGKYNIHMEIYSKKITDTPVTVNFYDESNELHLSGNAVINFKGWMPYYRSYVKDYGLNGMTKKAAYMTVSIDNSASAEPVQLCFDNWKLDASMSNLMALPLMVKDVGTLANQTQQPLMIYSFAYNANKNIALTEPTAEELGAIAAIKAQLPQAPDATDTDLAEARAYATGLGIKRNSDGTVKYPRIITSASAYNLTNQTLILHHLNALAASADAADARLFKDFMDAVLDANIFYRFPQLKWSVYADVRLIPRLMLALIPKMDAAQQTEWLKAVRWITEAGWAHAPLDYFANKYNSDIIYLAGGSNYYLSCAVNDPTPAVAVREMKAFKQMLELILTPVSGGYEIMKPDGCGFHHGVHYNNYMYSFNPWIISAATLQDTPFCVNRLAYDRIKKAMLTCFAMSSRSTPYSNADNPSDPTPNLYAKSLAGRHPFDSGQVNQFTPAIFKMLLTLSERFFGGVPDPELAAAYNYYMMTNEYQVPAMDFTGFYQFNYSPIGIYRTDDWVVTMRCPTTAAWGAEIYANKNRFGRYQSTGTMEVVYNGCKANSGIPEVAAGYDWNVVPGATTVHYTNWESMLPNGNLTTRFDQFSETTDYAGALAWNLGKAGVFSCEYDQCDTHSNGTVCFSDENATHLKFHKTVLAVDGMLFNMGSDISSAGVYDNNWITATNLFQEVGDDLTDFNVNGSMMTRNAAPLTLNCTTGNVWMVSPKGTGLIVPQGNKNVIVKYGEQEGPHGDGGTYSTAPEKAIGAKAYIEHGVKVADEKYSYVMVPGTTPDKLQGSVNDIVGRFDVISQGGAFHGIYYRPDSLTALSFYEPVSNTGLNLVKATGSQMLVMHQKQANGHMALAVCNPNLRPERKSSTLCDWASAPTETSISLNGEWMAEGNLDKNAVVNSPSDGSTVIDLTLSDGLPVYFDLKPVGSTGIGAIEDNEMAVRAAFDGNGLVVELTTPAVGDVTVDVYDVNGVRTGAAVIAAGMNGCRVNVTSDAAMHIVRVTSINAVKTLKVMR